MANSSKKNSGMLQGKTCFIAPETQTSRTELSKESKQQSRKKQVKTSENGDKIEPLESNDRESKNKRVSYSWRCRCSPVVVKNI